MSKAKQRFAFSSLAVQTKQGEARILWWVKMHVAHVALMDLRWIDDETQGLTGPVHHEQTEKNTLWHCILL